MHFLIAVLAIGFQSADRGMDASRLSRALAESHGAIRDARLVDIAPTVATWLGVGLPADLDGKPIALQGAN